MGCRVLIADNARFVRKMITSIVNGNGHEVVALAADGQEAVNGYCEHRPDVVIMDIVMPGMDGLAATQAIREWDPAANVIICTAVAEQSVVTRAITVGARDFVVKPVSTERLLQALDRIAACINESRTGGDSNGNAVGGNG